MKKTVATDGASDGEKTAVDNLSFSVTPGKVTGFLGPNGAGKTTTMRLILGLDYPDAGAVTIDGRPAEWLQRESLRFNLTRGGNGMFLVVPPEPLRAALSHSDCHCVPGTGQLLAL